jgi:hypothetical protein
MSVSSQQSECSEDDPILFSRFLGDLVTVVKTHRHKKHHPRVHPNLNTIKHQLRHRNNTKTKNTTNQPPKILPQLNKTKT